MAGGFVLGVDFGTSNTAAVLRDPDGPADRSLRPLLFDGVPQLPSAVFVAGDTRLAGRDALHHGLAQPAGLEPNPKRRIDDVTVLLSAGELSVAELFAVVLRRVREEATLAAGGPIGTLTLTCPIFWGPRRQSVLTSAARIAGLPEPVFVHEPVAAAAHYAAAHRSPLPAGRPVLVYDLGAGTCDATVVRRTPDGIDIVAGRGLDGVGGLDVDAAVVASIAAAVRPDDPAWQRLRAPRTAADLRARNTLWDGARTAKEQLSRSASTFVYVPLLEAEAPLGREQFDALAGPVLAQTVRLARDIVTDAGLTPTDLAAVLLVGGSSRLPLVASLLHRELGVAPILVDQPELAVALGSVTDAVRTASAPAPVLPEPPAAPVSLRKAPRKPVPPEPVERRTATRQLIGVIVVLLVGALVAALLALNNDGDRDRALRPIPSASATPTPAATGPFGNLSVRRDPDRFCRIGRSGPNAVYLDMPLILNWTTPRGSPTPSNVIVDLEIIARGEIVGPARYTHPESLRPTAPTAGDRAIDGYYRITFDDSLLGVSVTLTIRIEADREVRDTDSLDNQFGVRVAIPTSIGPEARLAC